MIAMWWVLACSGGGDVPGPPPPAGPDGGVAVIGDPPKTYVEPPPYTGCMQAFTSENSNAIYAAVAPLPSGDCTFDAVKTASTSIQLEWKDKAGGVAGFTLEPVACASPGATVKAPELALTVPEPSARACPAVADSLTKAVNDKVVPGASPLPDLPSTAPPVVTPP
jgi:hypothetical protein